MYTSTSSPFDHSTTPRPPVKSPRQKRILLFVCALIVTIAGVVTTLFFIEDKKASAPAQTENTLTLYYRDGKTILWQSDRNASPDAKLPGFAGEVINEVKGKIGYNKLEQGNWHITTTLAKPLQDRAKQQLREQQEQFSKQKVGDATLIAQDVTTGQIVSWAGNPNDPTSNTDAPARQMEVGTLALPLTYAAFIEKMNASAETMLDDTQTPAPGYVCTNKALPSMGGNCAFNFDYKYKGSVTLRDALATVRLVPAVKVAAQIADTTGNSTSLQTFAEGLTTDGTFGCYISDTFDNNSRLACYTAASFGDSLFAMPKDIIQAYATIANQGKKLPYVTVLKAAQDGKTQYENKQAAPTQATRGDTAAIISGILKNAEASYLPDKKLFTANGTAIATIVGLEPQAAIAAAIQFSSKYAVGIWLTPSNGAILGATENLTLGVTLEWLKSAIQK